MCGMSALKVIGYSRVSSQEQAAEGISLAAQRERIEASALATGAQLLDLIEDAGVSGMSPLADRPGGRRVADLMAARSPSVDAVVVCRLDRLGRDASETLSYLRRFARGDLGIVSLAERIDLGSPSGRALAQMSAVFAELERNLIAERTREAVRSLKRQRRRYGTIPYGFICVEDLLVEDRVEHEVLERIRRLRRRGATLERIAVRLNKEGVPPKSGARWYPSTVRSVLRTSASLAPA